MNEEELGWAVEQACLNAWPSPRQLVLGPWLLRAAGGPSRRINSVSPLRASHHDPLAMIGEAEPIYAALGQPLIVRVPALVRGVHAPLEQHGFDAQAEVCTLFTPLDDRHAPPDAPVTLTAAPTPEWLALRARLNGDDPIAERVVRAVTDSLILPRAYAGAPSEDGLAAVALGVLAGGFLVLEAVGTAPAMRGRGFGRQVVAALMAWARRQGARAACLQVAAANSPARRLYAHLGFDTDLYHYIYRCRERIG